MLFSKKKENTCAEMPPNCSPVILSSICTGEKVIGFKNNDTGEMVQAVSMKSDKDVDAFCARYGIKREDVKTVY